MTSPDDLDPELAAALAEDDDNDPGDPPQTFDTTDEEEAMDPAKLEAIREVRAEVSQPKNRGGRPKGSRTRREPAEPVAAPPISLSAPPIKARPLDAGAIWEGIIERLADRGIPGGAAAVTIGVTQFSTGPNREHPAKLNSIPGEAVGGSRMRTPGEDLQDYIERAYHVPLGTGPAKYRLMFRLRGASARDGDANLGVAELTLPAAADIRKRWEAVAQLQRDKERENDFGPVPRQAYRPQPAGYQGPYEGTGVTPPAPQPVAPSQSDAFAHQMLDRVWDMYERERRYAARLGEAPPPPPDPRLYGPPPAAVADGNLEERVARTVVETLRAMGITGAPAATAAPVAPPLTTPAVAQAVTAPMNAAKEFFTQMREFTSMKRQMREMILEDEPDEEPPPPPPAAPTVLADPEEDDRALRPINEQFARFGDAPIMYGKQADGESTLQWLSRLALGNPAISGKLLEKGASMLDQSSFGKLVGMFTQMGGPQAQAARNLPPNGVVVDATPQTNGAARGNFTPNIG